MNLPLAPRWSDVDRHPTLRNLRRRKHRLIVVLGIVAALYYFALPFGASQLRDQFALPIHQHLNLGLLFVLSQYPVGGLLAYCYLRGMRRIDAETQRFSAQAFLEEQR
ncbi:DUF485 domain-containing protein [Halotalea alkalilenta]|uniref:DUF485 domain-containing protein n=1 Tax=Halotalea alkalilenta TaxID=376489 RepID=UPI00069327F7|nr:DUF485 domain-containing protein [Halotalea alkalilenta]